MYIVQGEFELSFFEAAVQYFSYEDPTWLDRNNFFKLYNCKQIICFKYTYLKL